MKVIRARIGVVLASLGLLSSVLGLTTIMTTSTGSGIVVLAGGSSATASQNATVIEP